MSLRCWALVALVLFFVRPAYAQSAEDHVYVGGRIVDAAKLDDRPGRRWSQGGAVSLAPSPFVLGDRDRLSVRLDYRYTRMVLDRAALADGEPRPWNLHAVSPSIAYSRILGRRWILSLGGGPGIASDLRTRFSFDDVQITGFGSLTYLVGGDPHFRISFAVLAQNRAFFAPVLPFFTIDYRSQWVSLGAGIGGVHALALVGESAEIGVFGSVGGGQYHVRAPQAEFLRLVDVGVGPAFNLRLGGPVWLEGKGGWNVVQSGRFNDAHLQRVSGLGLDAAGAFVGQVGIAVR